MNGQMEGGTEEQLLLPNTHFLLKAASSRGSRMFSCGSQLLCLKRTEAKTQMKQNAAANQRANSG